MRKTLLFAILLLPHAFALGQGWAPPPAGVRRPAVNSPVPANGHNPSAGSGQVPEAKAQAKPAAEAAKPDSAKPDAPAAPPQFVLTDLQKARLDAARQKIWRWQDKINEALGEFSGQCEAAMKENKWPPVTCNWDTLAVTAQPSPTPPPAPPAPPSKP